MSNLNESELSLVSLPYRNVIFFGLKVV